MPSKLQQAKSRAETLTKFAIKQHNRRAKDIKSSRLKAERKAARMVHEQRVAHQRWQKEQKRRANEGGGMAGAMQGGMTGASVGGMWGPYGAAIGGAIGAIGGGVYGATQGKQAVADVAPYAAGVSQVAGGISQMRANKERSEKMMDMYGRMYGQRGGGFGSQPGAGATGAATAGGVSLAGPAYPTPQFGAGPSSIDWGSVASQSGLKPRLSNQAPSYRDYYLNQLSGRDFQSGAQYGQYQAVPR